MTAVGRSGPGSPSSARAVRRPTGAALIALYPGAWRRRYGDELEALLESGGLSARDRTVLMLHGVRDMGHPEIAALLGISVDAVKMSLFHAREKMRRRLARYVDRVPKKRPLRGGSARREEP